MVSKDMDQYIRYHKKPYAKYLDVQSFNAKYGTNIKEVEDYDMYFHHVFTEARKKQGPDDFLMVHFAHQDEFKDMVSFKSIAGIASKLKKKAKEAKDKVKEKIKAGAEEASKIAKKISTNPLDNEKPETPEVKSEVNDLDGLLSDNEVDVVEEEYDEEVEEVPETKEVAEPVKNIVTEKKKIADLVLKSSKDSEEYSQDMKHLIQFKSSKLPLEEQLMKGRPKYLKALKAYLKGDKDVEVKMSWSRKGGKRKGRMVKVADLNPKRDSLKALLRSSPGSLRVVECV